MNLFFHAILLFKKIDIRFKTVMNFICCKRKSRGIGDMESGTKPQKWTDGDFGVMRPDLPAGCSAL